MVIGRDGEIEKLAALARRVAAGRGAVVLVQGEPGIGRTSLLHAASVRCAAAGLHIRLGAASEPQQTVPFAALLTWFDADTPGADAIRALLDSDVLAGDAMPEIAIAEAILDHVETWCATGPLALIMDDIQWSDTSSVSVLQRLCARIDELPLLLMLSARPQPQDSAFTTLSAELVARRAPLIRLGRLSDEAGAELVSHIVGATPGRGLLREVAGASGNPRYITELVAALQREQAITISADAAETVAGQRSSTTLAQAISRRLDFLPRRTRYVLATAAALGPVVDVTELAAVLDRPLLEVWSIVSDVMATGVLELVDSEVVFRHELIRQVLSDQLPARVRAGLLRTAGRVLRTAPIERIAHYLAVADYELDDIGPDWLIAVGDKLAVRAPELAVRLLRRARTEADNPQLIRRYIEALLWSGRAAEAEAEVRVALSEYGDDIEVRWLLAQVCRARGRIAEAVDIAETALSTMDLDIEAAARFHGMCAVDNVFLERFDAAERAGRVAIAMGNPMGTPSLSDTASPPWVRFGTPEAISPRHWS